MIQKSMTVNKLKIIAIVTMFFDHFIAVFIPHSTLIGLLLRTPGRIVTPIMCYFIAEGYYHTSNRKKYIIRLLIFAAVSHWPYNLCFGFSFFQATSVIWGLALGLIALSAVKNDKLNIVIKVIVLIICCQLAITANWNYITVLWIVAFGWFYGDFKNQVYSFCAIGIFFHIIPTYLNFGFLHEGYPHWYQLGIFLAIPLLAMYNGKLGRKSKVMTWAFYVFYPTHLILLYLLRQYSSLSALLG